MWELPERATARVTAVVVKDDRIEFQLDGGGFGTFLDDTNTNVSAKPVEKSDYEKQLEKQIADTTDEDKKRSLQRDLDRERARRERQDANNQAAAQVASQIKAQQVAEHRTARFAIPPALVGSIPPDQRTPQEGERLADEVRFDGLKTAAGAPAAQNPAGDAAVPARAQSSGA